MEFCLWCNKPVSTDGFVVLQESRSTKLISDRHRVHLIGPEPKVAKPKASKPAINNATDLEALFAVDVDVEAA